jgi:hypothetical protein
MTYMLFSCGDGGTCMDFPRVITLGFVLKTPLALDSVWYSRDGCSILWFRASLRKRGTAGILCFAAQNDRHPANVQRPTSNPTIRGGWCPTFNVHCRASRQWHTASLAYASGYIQAIVRHGVP